MLLKDLENALSEAVLDLKPASEVPEDAMLWEEKTFDYSEQDNSKWRELITGLLKS